MKLFVHKLYLISYKKVSYFKLHYIFIKVKL